MREYPRQCTTWRREFEEEFTNPALGGWSVSLAGGAQQVSGSWVHLWTEPFSDDFPLVWRNDLFQNVGNEFDFEVRFRHSDLTAYGTTIAVNSAPYDGTRVRAGQALPAGLETILNIHHVWDSAANGVRYFSIRLLGGRVEWISSDPSDTAPHTLRVTLEEGNLYTLYVDGQRVGSAKSTLRPASMYIGNPTIQSYAGAWTQIYVDYVHISHCATWTSY